MQTLKELMALRQEPTNRNQRVKEFKERAYIEEIEEKLRDRGVIAKDFDWRARNPPKDYSEQDCILEGKRAIAARRIQQALRNGTIKRAKSCQICGDRCKTQAHHWKGYDYPFEVWWLCPRCNNAKRGLPHDGSLTLEEAKVKVIAEYARDIATTMRIADRRGKRWTGCDACGIRVKRRDMDLVFGNMLVCPYCYIQLTS